MQNYSSCNKAVTLGCEINQVREWDIKGGVAAYKFEAFSLLQTARLTVFDRIFEIHSLSHHFKNRSILLATSPFIR